MDTKDFFENINENRLREVKGMLIESNRAAKAGSVLEKQVGGDHYKKFNIQPIEFIKTNNLSFEMGNVVKYALRDKGGEEDIKKAIHYIEFELEMPKPPITAEEFCKENELTNDQEAIIKAIELYQEINSRDLLFIIKTFLEKMIDD